MHAIRLILGLLLLITPMAIHVDNGDNSWYGMTPIGGLMWDDGEIRLGLYSFDWYTKDGRNDYATKALFDLSKVRLLNIAFIQNSDGDLTFVGVMSLISMFAVALYLLSSIFENRIIGIVGNSILLLLGIALLIAFFLIDKDFTSSFDFNMPISSIACLVIAIIGIIIDATALARRD